MNAPPRPGGGADAGGDAARVRCLYCGANNFPASPTCWQCGRALRALQTSPAMPNTAPGMIDPAPRAGTPARYARAESSVSPGLAPKAAAVLGLTFPLIGLPVGMVFLMLDDERKARLGWITIGWSILGTVLNIILTIATLGPTLAVLKAMLPPGAHGGGLPGLPPTPGGDADPVNMLIPCLPWLLHFSF